MSNNLGLSQIADTQSNKHVTANDQVGEIDAALTEVLSVEVDDTNVATVLTEDFQRHAFFDVVDAVTPPDAAITVAVPPSSAACSSSGTRRRSWSRSRSPGSPRPPLRSARARRGC